MNRPSDVTKSVLKKSKKNLLLRFICSIIYRGLAMIIPIFFSDAINYVTDGEYKNALVISIIAIFVVILFRLFDIINTYTWHRLYNSMYDNYTKIGINKVFDNSLYSLSRFNIGEFLNMMSTDINVMADFYCNLVLRLIRIFEVLIIFIYFFIIDFYMGIFGIIMAVISVVVILLSSKFIEKLNHSKSIKFDNRNTVINEYLHSIREVKAFNMFEPIRKRIEKSTKEYTVSYLNQRVGEDGVKFSVLAFIEVFRWFIFIYGIYLIMNGKIEIGSLLIVYNYFTQLIEGFSEFAVINTGIRQLKVSENRFYQLIIYSRDKLIIDKKYHFRNFDIYFNEVLYGDKLNPTLANATFKIESNSINVVSGLVESGTSGVVDLLLKLNSQHSGKITIGGISISNIDFDSYYNLVSCVDKNVRFLNLSIKDNLNIVNENFEEIVYICKKLNIHNEILKLKYGYDTLLNSNEDKMSRNTKILLNIARILLKKTKIMIFDEILGLLNKESRNNVLNILTKMKGKYTIIIIDEFEEIFQISDNVILLNDGTLYKSGKYNEIFDDELYKKIINN